MRLDKRTPRAAAALVPLVTLLAACGGTPEAGEGAIVGSDERASAHALHSDRLQTVMVGLDRLTYRQLPQELDAGVERRRRLEEVSTAAGRIATTARYIPDVLVDVRLPPEYADEFRSLSKELETRAERLHREAPSMTVDAVQAEFSSLRATCARCHARFRVLPVVGGSADGA